MREAEEQHRRWEADQAVEYDDDEPEEEAEDSGDEVESFSGVEMEEPLMSDFPHRLEETEGETDTGNIRR